MGMRIDWLGNSGFRALRTSAGAHALVRGEAEKVLSRADIDGGRSEYGMDSTSGSNRARAIVYTANAAAAVENAKHNTLIRALGGG